MRETNWQEQPALKDLGERVQALRRRQGISQEELAAALGVSRQAVSKWESRQAQPELEKAVGLAAYFGVSLDWLLLGQEAEKPEKPAAAETAATEREERLAGAMVVIATALTYMGLLLAWGIWDYWQVSFSVAVGGGFVILGLGLLGVGAQLAAEAQRGGLVRRFWRWSIWPVAYLGIAAAFTTVCGRLTAPTLFISDYFLGYWAEGVFALGVWVIICVCVFKWSKKDCL